MREHPPHLLSYFIGACEQNFDFERGSRECDYTWLFHKISGYVFLARTFTLYIQLDRLLNRLHTKNALLMGIGDSRLLTCLGVSTKRDDDRHVVFLFVSGIWGLYFTLLLSRGSWSSAGVLPHPGLCPPVVRLLHRQLRSGFQYKLNFTQAHNGFLLCFFNYSRVTRQKGAI